LELLVQTPINEDLRTRIRSRIERDFAASPEAE
jgi:hypothetical protein